MNKLRTITISLLAAVFTISAGMAIQPLDNSITQLSHDDSNWVYRTDTVSTNGNLYAGYGYFDIAGARVEGTATFDINGYDTFTAIIDTPDNSRIIDGFASFRLDGVDERVMANGASVYNVRVNRGQGGVPINIDLTGHRKLTVSIVPAAVLVQPRLSNHIVYDQPYAAATNVIDVWTNNVDNADMVYVPAGSFVMGSRAGIGNPNEYPRHSVTMDGFYIYKDNVTVGQFRSFCRLSGYNFNWARKPIYGWQDDNPMTLVSYYDAQAYATWAGGTLPTEAQWELAACGTDNRSYPWGNTWNPSNCAGQNGRDRISATGSYPYGASQYGVQDMVGNIRQWCADSYDARYYDYSPTSNPNGGSNSTYRTLRGSGGYNNTDYRVAVRSYASPTQCDEYTGFRIIRTSLPQTVVYGYNTNSTSVTYDYQYNTPTTSVSYDYQYNNRPVVIVNGTPPFIDDGNYTTTIVYRNGEYVERYYYQPEHIWRYRRPSRPYNYSQHDYNQVPRPDYPPAVYQPSYNEHPGKTTAPVYNDRKPDYYQATPPRPPYQHGSGGPVYRPRTFDDNIQDRPGMGRPDTRPTQQPVRPNIDTRPTGGKPDVGPSPRPNSATDNKQAPITKSTAPRDNNRDNAAPADNGSSTGSGKSTAPGGGK